MPPPYHDPIRRAAPTEGPVEPERPRDADLADAANLVKVAVWFAPACIIMLSMVWYFFHDKGWIPGPVFGLLVVLNFPIAAVGVFVIHAAIRGASAGLVHSLYSAGNVPPPRSYPRQEAMVARGQYVEAAEHYRDHLVVEPDDNEARLRLAVLYETQLAEPPAAEALYKEVRTRQPTPHEEITATNGLIDLYRRTGQRGRLVVELARFADRYSGSTAGEAARRELLELKREEPPPA